MRVAKILVRDVPGLPSGTEVRFGPGFNVLVGQNGAGKSTMAALVRDSLFPRVAAARGEAELEFVVQGQLVEHVLHDDAAPLALPGRRPRLAHCYVQRLTELLGENGAAELTALVARELYGGVDPGRLRVADVVLDGRRREARLWLESERELLAVEAEQNAVAQEELRIRELERRRVQAGQAGERLLRLRARAQWLVLATESAAKRSRLAQLPDVVTRMDGGEKDRLATLRAELRAVAKSLREVHAGRKEKQAKVRQIGIGPVPIGERVLARAVDLGNRLQQSEHQTAQMEVAVAAARSRLLALGAEPPVPVERFEEVELRAYAAAAAAERRLHDSLAAVQAQRRSLPVGRARVSSRVLQEGIQHLTDWLAVAAAESRVGTIPAMLTFAIAIGLGSALHPAWFGAAGAAFAAWAVDRLPRRGSDAERARAEAGFADLQLRPPTKFAVAEVRRRLFELHRGLAKVTLAEQGRQRAAELRAEIESLSEELETARVHRCEVGDRLGLPRESEPTLLSLADLDRVVRRHEASSELAAREGELAARRSEEDLRLAELQELLAAFPKVGAIDAETAYAAVEQLAKKDARLRVVRAELDGLDAEERRLVAVQKQLQQDVEDQCAALGVSAADERGLEERWGAFDVAQALRNELRELEREQSRLAVQVGEDPVLQSMDAVAVDAEIESAEASSGELATVAEELGRIRNRIATVTEGRALADAIAARDAAAESVREGLLRAARDVARNFLLDLVVQDGQSRQRPQLVTCANQFLEAFTAGAWQLHYSAEQNAFLARDRDGRSRPLAELSDGTRVQVLLAVRLGYVASQEDAVPVPLFFDEVLATADPDRFRSVVGSMLALVRMGRQVVYMTANPAEVATIHAIAEEIGATAPHVSELRGGMDPVLLPLPPKDRGALPVKGNGGAAVPET